MRIIIGFIASLILVTACSKKDPLIGKWELTYINYERHFETVPEELRDLFREKIESQTERLKGKAFFVLKEDKTLELIAPDFSGKSATEKGKYSINKIGDSIFFDISMDESYRIDSLSNELLIITTDETPMRTLTLKKVQE